MKMQKWVGGLSALVFVAMFSLAATVGAADIATQVQAACTKCHSPKRICLNLGAKNQTLWKGTITTMVGKGAQLPHDRIDAAAAYLANLKPGESAICP